MTQLRQRLGKRYANHKHVKHVASLPCMVCGAASEAHHLLKPWRGIRGTGRRAGDENVVPLCPEHHRALHAAGDETRWFAAHFLNGSIGKERAEGLWNMSPYFETLEVKGKNE